MDFIINLKRILLILFASFALTACATQKKVEKAVEVPVYETKTQADVFIGGETVEYLDEGKSVPDRVFFATNKSVLTTSSRDTLRKQAAWLRANKDIDITIEGHADERGTREYNLALGDRRANSAKDYLLTYGIPGKRISVISYGKERPVNSGSTPLAWSQNRRAVSVIN